MVTKKDKVLRDLRKFIAELRKNGIPVQKALLFASWSKGNAGLDSDIDVALISSVFSGDRFSGRRRIVPFRRRINNNIEPVPFDPESF